MEAKNVIRLVVNGLIMAAPLAGAAVLDEIGKLLLGHSSPLAQSVGVFLGSLAPLLRQTKRREWTDAERAAKLLEKHHAAGLR